MIQLEAATKDPVCGTTVDRATALRAERNGEVLYFCSSDCREAFLSTPMAETISARCA